MGPSLADRSSAASQVVAQPFLLALVLVLALALVEFALDMVEPAALGDPFLVEELLADLGCLVVEILAYLEVDSALPFRVDGILLDPSYFSPC